MRRPRYCILTTVQRLSQDNRTKQRPQRRAWLLLGSLDSRSCPCKQPACPAPGD
ncbi:hypothetical protein J6590_071581 [Homalodisca vitripennis]|nr:hypothetical protein J6590_071581 [Homalodisca vitripennis]